MACLAVAALWRVVEDFEDEGSIVLLPVSVVEVVDSDDNGDAAAAAAATDDDRRRVLGAIVAFGVGVVMAFESFLVECRDLVSMALAIVVCSKVCEFVLLMLESMPVPVPVIVLSVAMVIVGIVISDAIPARIESTRLAC